jgi:hypothetical protein
VEEDMRLSAWYCCCDMLSAMAVKELMLSEFFLFMVIEEDVGGGSISEDVFSVSSEDSL